MSAIYKLKVRHYRDPFDDCRHHVSERMEKVNEIACIALVASAGAAGAFMFALWILS